MPVTGVAVTAQRSARVLRSQNKRAISPPDAAPVRKRARGKKAKEETVKEEEEGEEYSNGENTSPDASFTTTLSEYELKVQQKIAERQRLLESLGILKAKQEFVSSIAEERKRKLVYRGIVKEKSPQVVVLRRSLRQQHLTPDGLHLTLPSDEQVARSERRVASPVEYPRPPPGPAPLMDFYSAPNRVDCEAMLKDLATTTTTSSSSTSSLAVKAWGGSVKSVVQKMRAMKVVEEQVVKVVPDRIFSVQFHPTVAKTLVLVGGKWGQLGIWEVGREDKSSGAYSFQPHSSPINCLTVAPDTPWLTHTTSYDGSLRQTDLEAGQVTEVYGLPDNQRNHFLSWHAQLDQHTFLLAASLGRVLQVDSRVSGGQVREYLMHRRKTVKVVTAHPQHPHYCCTGGSDGLVCLWDIRSCKQNKPLDYVALKRHVSGLEFSCSGKVLVSTSMDDYLRFITCDRTALKVESEIKHNNQTGRWLSTFKARFVPTRDDLVCVGSMLRPRRVEVWGRDGHLYHQFSGEALATVNSVLALHPQRHALAGCNSTGRVYLFD